MHLPLPLRTVAVIGTAALAAFPLQAQEGTWALTNARIETVTRGVIERGTIVIRDGLIQAVGPNVNVPADARVVDLANRWVYPGIIDLTSSMGLPAAAAPTGGRGGGAAQQQGSPASEFTGLDPRRQVASEVRPTDNDVRTAREHGITLALVAPVRGAVRGQSALVPMRDGFDRRMIVQSPVAMHMGFEGTPGRYPATLLGVQAEQRQRLYDAQRQGLIRDAYDRGARGMTRPEHDEDMDALVPVVRGQMPVFFAASNENEIRRAVRLGQEFDLHLAVVGAMEGFRALDALRSVRHTVVTVDYPRPVNVTGWSYRASLRRSLADSAAADSAVQQMLEANAATLHRAGIRFALASGAASPGDFIANVRRAVRAGLPTDVAIQALTIRPAEVTGVADRLGSIEPGKIANLVVTDGPLLADTTRVRLVFVDGVRFEPAPPARGGARRPAAPAARAAEAERAAETAQVGGVWAIVVNSPQGASRSTLTARQSGNVLDGSMATDFGTAAIADATVDGNTVRWRITLDIMGQNTTVAFTGEVDGDRMNGSAELGTLGSATFTGARQP